jgi:hypothetical protein
MKQEGNDMKQLKIDRGNGYFLLPDGSYLEIDKINKEHLMHIVTATLAGEIEFDAYDEEKLQNQAHRVVYKNIIAKLQDLANRRKEYKDESETLFQSEFDRYRQPS